MGFSSIPAYLDPANWQQQPNPPPHGLAVSTQSSSQVLPPTPPPPRPPPPPLPAPDGSGGPGSGWPGSMADRARMANIPMPEQALKCPRCESTNTKFCYFNNYSLSQPRHFCKTCRRYWTRGGALRSVPVGGGCRRNKPSKGGSSSKSPLNSDRQTISGGSTGTVSSHSGLASEMLGLGPQFSHLRFMAPLHHLTHHEATAPPDHLGLNYGSLLPIQPGGINDHLSFHIGSALAGTGLGNGGFIGGNGSGGGSLLGQWRQLQQFQHHQHFPFFGGFETSNSSNFSPGIYPFEGGVHDPSPNVRPEFSSSGATQAAPVKMEASQELNLSRQFAGINPTGNNDQYWTGSAWTDLTSFSSSSTSYHL